MEHCFDQIYDTLLVYSRGFHTCVLVSMYDYVSLIHWIKLLIGEHDQYLHLHISYVWFALFFQAKP